MTLNNYLNNYLCINYLITESEVVTGKSQTEPCRIQVNTEGRGLRFSRNDGTVEVIKLFIIWHQQQLPFALFLQARNRSVGITGE